MITSTQKPNTYLTLIKLFCLVACFCLLLLLSATAGETGWNFGTPDKTIEEAEAKAEVTTDTYKEYEAVAQDEEPEGLIPLRSSHLLRPGDVLDISVHEHPEFMIRLRVDTDGSIRFPLCGKVVAAGLTAGQISEALSKKLQEANISGAQVFVFVSMYTPRYIYVFGEIRGQESKALEIPPEGRMTSMQAISGAGGFTPKANLQKVFVLRQTKQGKIRKIPVNIAGIMSQKGAAADVELQPGDTVVVPPAMPVSVLGFVNTPGAFEIDTSNPCSAAEMISRAGGFQEGADRDQTLLLRANSNGGPETTVSHIIPVGRIMRGEIQNPINIEAGDTIIARAMDKIHVLGQVQMGGAFYITPEITMTVTRSIAMASGFSRMAADDNVLLIRGGTVKSINLRKALRQDGDLSLDEPLIAGDIVYVPESRW
ncbi:MAG: polysaccharide biosynthesis/export family protein [Planctomycetes bacterium]|nr:polysaccharide biosynthesis/export family protein [Planctomycetota bacterium]